MSSQPPTPNAQDETTKTAKDTKNSLARATSFAFFVLFVPFVVPTSAQGQEKITEIRIHGNHTTPDADVLALSGLATGADASEARLKEAEQKLKSAHRFEGVELRKRYLSITDPSQILVMIVVDEHPAVSRTDLTPGPFKETPRHADVDADSEA
jgi:outer membrane protein assembly factor BamA